MLPYLPNVDPSWLPSAKKIRSTARDLKEFLFQLMIVQVSCRSHLFPGDISKGFFIIQNHYKTVVQVGLAGWPPGPRRPVTTRILSLFLRFRDPQLLKPSNLPRGFPSILRTEGGLSNPQVSVPGTFPPLLFSTKTSWWFQPI